MGGRSREAGRPSGPPVSEWEANDGLVLRAYRQADQYWIDVPGIAIYAFATSGPVEAIEAEGKDEAVRDVWLRSVLPLVVQARGTQVLHASAVRRSDGGIVALCGRATTGKSTIAAALEQSLRVEVVADDALPFEVRGEHAVARPVPHRLRLRPASAEALGLPRVTADRSETVSGPLATIVLLDPRASGPADLERVPPGEAFGALMPHAYCFSLDDGKERLAAEYANLCASVPVHRLGFPQQLSWLDKTLGTLRPLFG